MATKRCLYISTFGPQSAPHNNAAEAIFKVLVAPVFRLDFPDFELVRYNSELIHGAINDQILEDLQTADLVVADLTELTPSGFYELGVRHATGLPTVLLAQTGHSLPFDHKDFRFVVYSYRATDDEVEQRTRGALIESIKGALNRAPALDLPTISSREARNELAARVQEAAEAIQALRINSTSDVVASLEQIANDLDKVDDKQTPSAMHEAGEKLLKIISRVADQLATVRGSRIIVAGIISLVLGGAGYSALTIYGLTLAFWQGPEMFSKAIDTLVERKKGRQKRGK
jgi:nucleoside 2-deoxyribosyltransferase